MKQISDYEQYNETKYRLRELELRVQEDFEQRVSGLQRQRTRTIEDLQMHSSFVSEKHLNNLRGQKESIFERLLQRKFKFTMNNNVDCKNLIYNWLGGDYKKIYFLAL